MNFTTEQMQKAKQAKTAEELLKIAKENGVELTEEQAKTYFAELHKEGELSDEELDAVVGGDGDSKDSHRKNGTDPFNRGDIVEDDAGIRYEILYFDSEQCDGIEGVIVHWYCAIVKCVPESAKPYTCLSVGDTHYVHSAIVKKVS